MRHSNCTNPKSAWPEGGEPAAPTNWPRISIVTPNFNYGNSIAKTIRSVINQNYPNLEYIVIDGGSTDDSCQIIDQFSDKLSYWVSEPDGGQYHAINKGFSRATGDIFGWLNSDDILFPWSLFTVASIFRAFPETDWLMGQRSKLIDGVPLQISQPTPLPRHAIYYGLYRGGMFGFVQQESCFWRSRLWQQHGPLDDSFEIAADYDLWTRFADSSELTIVNTILGGFSLTDHNRSIEESSRYFAECDMVQSRWSQERRNASKKLKLAVERYYRWKKITGLKRLSRSIGRLAEHTSPAVHWDFTTSKFQLQRVPAYP